MKFELRQRVYDTIREMNGVVSSFGNTDDDEDKRTYWVEFEDGEWECKEEHLVANL